MIYCDPLFEVVIAHWVPLFLHLFNISFPSISIGFYCPEGSEVPTPCPANTIRDVPGAVTREECLPCPPGNWCKAGWNLGVNSEWREWELLFRGVVCTPESSEAGFDTRYCIVEQPWQ